MKPLSLSFAAFALLTSAACSTTREAVTEPRVGKDPNLTATDLADASTRPTASREEATDDVSHDARQVGDYVTLRFSGKKHKTPLLLTERIVGRDAESLTIDYAFTSEGGKAETLRVRSVIAGAQKGSILSVFRVEKDGKISAAEVETFEALMQKTAMVADQNDELVSEEDSSVEVAGRSFKVKKAKYNVRIGQKKAVLSTMTSGDFAWGDFGGDIVQGDGTVLYRAEVIAIGQTDDPVAALEAR